MGGMSANLPVHASAVVAALAFCLLAVTAPAHAQSRDCVRNTAGETVCPPARTQCMAERDNPNIKCSPPDGGIIADRYGKAVCGVGACMTDWRLDVRRASLHPGLRAGEGRTVHHPHEVTL
jgi:hypothetical protein